MEEWDPRDVSFITPPRSLHSFSLSFSLFAGLLPFFVFPFCSPLLPPVHCQLLNNLCLFSSSSLVFFFFFLAVIFQVPSSPLATSLFSSLHFFSSLSSPSLSQLFCSRSIFTFSAKEEKTNPSFSSVSLTCGSVLDEGMRRRRRRGGEGAKKK